jgi:hypothetical protein
MPAENSVAVEAEYHEATGALAALVKLREELATWTEQDDEDCDGETLERVLDHIQSLESAYRSRKVLLEERAQGG